MSAATSAALARWREPVAALLVQVAFLAAFFWTPLSRWDEVHYSAADLTQSMSLTRLEPGHAPGNQLQSDAVTQMQPWALFNRAELAEGRFPLWNPHNGAGAPHFANYQSAVLSPFSVPFYVLDFKAALLVSAGLKLLALGFFTYLFLRELGLAWSAATLGGVAFQFAGHNVLLLYFPHVGAMVALPAALFCAERVLRRVEDELAGRGRAHVAVPLVGLAASLLAGLLAGNPEPFYFGCWGVGAWMVARVVGLWRAHRRSTERRLAVARAAGGLVLACAIAAGLGAFQVLPFLEYLQSSRVLEERSLRQTPLDPGWWPLYAFPDALGNPSASYRVADTIPPPNYELVHMSYTGALVLLFAALCPFLGRARGRFFFPALALVWFVYAHDVLGAYDVFAWIPTLDMAPMNRSQGLWNFALACAAATALDGLVRRAGARAWFAAGWWTFAACLALVAAAIGATRIVDRFQEVPSPFHGRFLQFVPAHFEAMALTTIIGIAAGALAFVVRARALRTACAIVVVAAVFAQTGWLLRDYNPVSPDAFVFPRTDRVEALAESLAGERVAILGRDGLPPDSNLAYGISQLASYDGMWVGDLDRLYRDHFGDSDNWRPILRGSHRSLRLFGTRHVLAKWGWNFLDSGLRDMARDPALAPRRVELLARGDATQTFQCYGQNLDTVMVVLSTPSGLRPCTLRFRLEDPRTDEVLVERTLTGREIAATVHTQKHVTFPGDVQLGTPGRPVVFRFPPIRDSFNRQFRIVLRGEGGRPGETVIAWHSPKPVYTLGTATHEGRKLAGELLFDWVCGDSLRFEPVREIGDFTLFRLRDAVPVHAFARGRIVAQTDEEALELVRSPSFDPRRLSVVQADDPALAGEVFASAESARRRTVVQFEGSDHCFLVSEDGRRAAHIDDEITFLANRFAWNQIRRLPASDRAKYEFVPDDDPAGKRAVGLVLVNPAETDERSPEVLLDTPTLVRLRVTREHPGTLIVASAFDPGWKARVDGRDAPVLRANYAFQAVDVPAGTSVVELRYLPDSLVLGLWVGAASLLAGLAAFVLARRRARAGSRPPSPGVGPAV